MGDAEGKQKMNNDEWDGLVVCLCVCVRVCVCMDVAEMYYIFSI